MFCTIVLDVDPTQFLWPAIGMVLAVVALIIGVRLARRRMNQTIDTAPPAGFTIGDLRQLAKEGKLSPEEFERAKSKVVDATKRATSIKPAQEIVSTKETPPSLQ
jgi:hypothetical protein